MNVSHNMKFGSQLFFFFSFCAEQKMPSRNQNFKLRHWLPEPSRCLYQMMIIRGNFHVNSDDRGHVTKCLQFDFSDSIESFDLGKKKVISLSCSSS